MASITKKKLLKAPKDIAETKKGKPNEQKKTVFEK